MRIRYSGICEQGMRDGVNQDAIGMYQSGESGLFFVSDGMGGHYAGERASGAIQEALALWWMTHSAEQLLDFQETVEQLQHILADTHTRIQQDLADHCLCGATIVLLFIQEDRYAVLWSGDSRCYMLERELFRVNLKQLTIDDTWENFLAKGYTAEEMTKHPLYGKLLYAVGAGEKFCCHIQQGRMKEKSLFVLCSDGVYKYADKEKMDAEMKAALKRENMEVCIKNIRDAVYEKDAPDNLSCVLVGVF